MRSLRETRVRLDSAMLVVRAFLEVSMAELRNVHLFVGGSPQRRGHELYACNVDLVFRQQLFRWTLPTVFLEGGQLCALMKTVWMLWQKVLHMGPKLLPAMLPRVRSIWTDGGTERLIVSQRGFPGRVLQVH